MNVLFVTFYYSPDLSAGSFRAAALVEALLARIGPHSRIDVLTSSPNRYATLKLEPDESLQDPRVRIHRARVPPHKSGVVDQARSFSAFARSAYREAIRLNPDVVVATSSRLFSAALGASIARRLGKPLYLDIRDIFSETIEGVFGAGPIRLALPAIAALERWTLRQAERINVVSPAFVDYFAPRVGHRDFAQFTNGIDDLFLAARPAPRVFGPDEPPVVLAAGNIGEGQGLHHIVPGLALAFPHMRFRVIGDGGRREALANSIAAAGTTNVELILPMPRERLIEEYRRASVLFTHLNDLAAFRRVLPSKLFEYGATGLPMLAGVAGFSRRFIERHIEGAAVFDPCDLPGAVAALRTLCGGPAQFDRSGFRSRFARGAIMDAMAADIIEVVEASAARSGRRPVSAPAA